MPSLSDIRELKSILQIDPANTAEDKVLMLYLSWATEWLEELLDRKFAYNTYTEYPQGTGCTKMVLKHRPVYPNPPAPYSPITIIEDQNGFFGAAPGAFATTGTAMPLVYGEDYTLQIDRDDGGSRSAVLFRINDYWFRPTFRQAGLLTPFIGDDFGSYKAIYTAGYTLDTLPGPVRMACVLMVSKLRVLFPMGMELTSDSYDGRNVSVMNQKEYLLSLIKPMVWPYYNRFW